MGCFLKEQVCPRLGSSWCQSSWSHHCLTKSSQNSYLCSPRRKVECQILILRSNSDLGYHLHTSLYAHPNNEIEKSWIWEFEVSSLRSEDHFAKISLFGEAIDSYLHHVNGQMRSHIWLETHIWKCHRATQELEQGLHWHLCAIKLSPQGPSRTFRKEYFLPLAPTRPSARTVTACARKP